jgi:Zn-dependent protease with chaperone function
MDAMKYVTRAALAVSLLVGFYVLALGVAVAVVVALVEVLRLGFRGLLIANVFALVVPVVFAVGYGVFGRSRAKEQPGVLVTEAEEPRLWALSRELADLAGTRCVDEIRLVAEANAAVSDTTTWLGLRSGTRRLYLGVPLLLGLDEAQVRSVLAHEFGHYAGRHTSLSTITYRGAETIRRTLDHLGTHVVARVFRLYARLYFAVSRTVNRRQELEADRLSVEAVGPDVAASALLELAPLVVAWHGYVGSFAGMGRSLGRRPTGLMAGFAHHLAHPEVVKTMQEVRETPREERQSVYDSHPTVTQRVAALLGGAALPAHRGGSAIDLLAEPDRAFAELEDTVYAESGRTPTPLPDLAPLAGADRLAHQSAAFDQALLEQGRNAGIGTVYHALANGTAARLLRPLLPDDDQEVLPRVMAHLIGSYLGAALVAADHARVELDWGTGWTVVDPAGVPLELSALVEEVLANPKLAGDLHELMRLSGVPDTWRPPEHVPDPTPAGPDQVQGVLSPVNAARTLVVTGTGLLWLTQSWADRMGIALRMNGREAGPLFQKYVEMGPEKVVRTRRARVIPWSSVAELRVVPRSRGRAWLVVAVAGGEPLVVKVQKNTQEAGQPWAAIAHHLGDRFLAEMRMPTRV